MKQTRSLFWILLIGFLLKPGSAWSRVFLNQDQALQLAFSSATAVDRKNIYLTDEQKRQIEKSAKSKVESNLVTYYVGTEANGAASFAFFSSHIVRTMPETLMAVLDQNGRLRFVELLAFNEPEDYLPPKKWVELFREKKLDDDLWVKRGIRNVTGATLTTQSMTEAVRRILATFEVAIQPYFKDKK